MAKTSLLELTLADIEDTGVRNSQAADIHQHLRRIVRTTPGPANLWNKISHELLAPAHPFALHRLLYHSTFANWSSERLGPPPAWTPSLADAKQTNIGRVLAARSAELLGSYINPVASFHDFYKLSVNNPEAYWNIVLENLSLKYHKRPSCILKSDETLVSGEPCPGGRWMPGAVLNAAECCLQIDSKARAQEAGILWRDEGQDDSPIHSLTMAELRQRVCRVANALEGIGFRKGDAIAINMPMSVDAIVISFPRTWSVKRCGEMARKLRYFQDQIAKAGITPAYRPTLDKDIDLDELESKLTELEAESLEINANTDKLQRTHSELKSFCWCYRRLGHFSVPRGMQRLYNGREWMPRMDLRSKRPSIGHFYKSRRCRPSPQSKPNLGDERAS